MNSLFIFTILVLGAQVVAEKNPVNDKEKSVLKTQKEKASYSIGLDIGNNFRKQSIDIDPNLLFEGLKAGFTSKKSLLTEAEAQEALTNFQKEVASQQEERDRNAAVRNKKEGEDFLANKKKKEGVVTLPSGLQYKVLREGNGKTPKMSDTVLTHYRGTLIDGTEFDSSYKRGEPISFPLNQVIAGWTEALQLMKVGSKWELVIPSNLAYGERGSPPIIGPHSTLIFQIELLGIK